MIKLIPLINCMLSGIKTLELSETPLPAFHFFQLIVLGDSSIYMSVHSPRKKTPFVTRLDLNFTAVWVGSQRRQAITREYSEKNKRMNKDQTKSDSLKKIDFSIGSAFDRNSS